jgi:tripartite-type tricarboxylate transporter receptor subunit TctC
VVIDNMPGAGGLIASNFIARQAPRDGLTVGFIGENAALAQLTRDAGVQFDLRQFGAIGASAATETDVCVMSRASGLDLNAWRKARVAPRMAVTSLRSGPYARLVLLSSALNLPVRAIVGYQGTAQIRLAMDGGEVEGMCSVLGSYNSAFEPKDNYRAVLQDGEKASQLLDGVPVASQLVQDARGRELLDYASRIRALPRYFVVPPETPPDRLAVLRAAFDETMRDAVYLAAARATGLDIAPLSAEDIEARLSAVLGLPAEARERIAALLSAPKAS